MENKTVSIIIPAYNEEKRLPITLEKWAQFLNPKSSNFKVLEIIIIDDGSQDKTIDVAKSFSGRLPVKAVRIKPNRGKGFAVKTGVLQAAGDLIFIYDADAAVSPQEIEKLILEINNADIVIGSRKANGSQVKMSFLRKIIGICFHIFCLPLIPGIHDASCGAKLFKTDLAKILFSLQKTERFAFDIEILLIARKLGYKIKEVGVAWTEVPGSKINILKDGFEMFACVLKLYEKYYHK